MNKAKLKSYAPAARRDFIQAVTDRAHFFGLSEKQIVPVEEAGDVAIIGGRPFPRAVAAQRRKLDARVKRDGFSQVMEAVAYTWFNRFLALRYMELHGYLEHGFRVLSNSGSSSVPEILDHVAQLDLPGLNNQKVVELKLDGSKDAELYRLLLVAQCNALHSAMPFLFEKIEDETELLLPDNLLHSDSLIRKLVTEIDEEDWKEVEIIGWLYQFYISEKKGQVIGKVVKSEDIPAATQLFTPNWIVKYLVQNSLGRQWLATYPDSPLKTKMKYYIEPAEQLDEVEDQLAAITPDSLDPEKLTLLDPACGSGHILVEAYDVFKEIYLERGYSNRDFPRLILEKNLYGLDIDDRAAQMAGFALLMKARSDDRRIMRSDNPVKLNVLAIHESMNITIDNTFGGEYTNTIRNLIDIFRHAKTFGSLITVPNDLFDKLINISTLVEEKIAASDLFVQKSAMSLSPLIRQALVLAKKFNAVIMNPPYMGWNYFSQKLKELAKSEYRFSQRDLYAMFIERGFKFSEKNSFTAMITMHGWLFQSTYEELRNYILSNKSIKTLAHLGARAFSEISGEVVQTAAFVINNSSITSIKPVFIRLTDGNEEDKRIALENKTNISCSYQQNDFLKINGCPIAYWISKKMYDIFCLDNKIGDVADAKKGFDTGDNNKYLRLWYEVDIDKICLPREYPANFKNAKWFGCSKGGTFRRWYGNVEYIFDWENNGYRIKNAKNSAVRNENYYFKKGITWSDIATGNFSARLMDKGYGFDVSGPAIFAHNDNHINALIGLLNSKVTQQILDVTMQGMHYSCGVIATIPSKLHENKIDNYNEVEELIDIARKDWNNFETSWDFKEYPLITPNLSSQNISEAWETWQLYCSEQISRMQELETNNNRLVIETYNLQDELSPEVPDTQITLARADREADMKRLISYAIGCMMGRYSLNQPGLVYANIGNINFDLTKYQTLPADEDGIVPLMDMEWFPDDATNRFEEFLKVAWTPETLEENLKFLADSLSPKGGETSRETIRRYISTQFYKDHLQTYKKRPIYWLFSSGKQRAFECLVYLHRYNESTLSRMRNEYVTPLQGKFSAQVDYLVNEVNAATSTAERNRLQKQLDTLRKKQVELASFDDLLRHYADQRIRLDLDEGVKVNYGKFGGLLAGVKTVTGG